MAEQRPVLTPFHEQTRLVISGGCLGKKIWVPEVVTVDGNNFLALDRKDRMLALALGMDTKLYRPLEKNEDDQPHSSSPRL